jgi:hypothetical protein
LGSDAVTEEWAAPDAHDVILARLAAQAQPADPMVANGARHVGAAPHLVWSRTGSHLPARPIMENEQRA